jgi:hypothetical protein
MKYRKYLFIEEQNISLTVNADNDAEADEKFSDELSKLSIKHTSEIYKERNDA